ncbi:MAG: glucoamylase [Betaproteobacteria bacterium RIFCSPLOWO2_02_FULL_67_26]|nr:MAG: glucoamylase [Betaproteobacteria bacterium RIFCSPLOWO2_02_FULL_67_26]
MTQSLDLALIGNCSVAALVDSHGELVWACVPRLDGDPVFCSLLRKRGGRDDYGYFAVELAGLARSEQEYLPNTAVTVTRLYDADGGAIEIKDAAPRFRQFGRMFSPTMVVRQVRRLAGSPRITIRLRPARDYGASRAALTFGTNHVRYLCGDFVLRATTDCSITALVEEVPFVLQSTVSFVLGPDETLQGAVAEVARRFLEETADYWREWVRNLSIPFEWQDAVIRAAIALKLSVTDDTGAIAAAVTTSIPEAAASGRNWDYRYCWLRDAYYTVSALNRLDATRTLERYLGYIINVAASAPDARLQPVYRLSGLPDLEEREVASLPGYRGIGPVRVGNQAWRQVQHDVYGSAVLAATHVFFDRRLLWSGNEALFAQLEALGERATEVWSQPDAGLWELRGVARVHTYSSVMCWVACDRLAKIAAHLGLPARAARWRARADTIHRAVCERAWSPSRGSFVATLDGNGLDAGLLLLAELGFIRAEDPRFAATVAAIERELRRGDFVFRYVEADDFGVPQNAFLACTYWYIDALTALGRREEARALFENLLACRNPHGLLSEHIDPATRELWGNFPQTYSMVGLINSATRLSIPWEEAF